MLGSVEKEGHVFEPFFISNAAQPKRWAGFKEFLCLKLKVSVFLCTLKPEFENFGPKKLLIKQFTFVQTVELKGELILVQWSIIRKYYFL